MTDEANDATKQEVAGDAPVGIDRGRVRSFAGMVLGRLGPRAHGVASGTFMTLLVGEQTKSLTWVMFAITAHRFATWIAHPLAGRWSDRSGRRVPFMVSGMLVAGACTALYTHAGGYWTLVGLIVLSRLAFVGYSLPSTALTPEVFGGARWIRALVAVSVGGLVVGLSIRLTVVATWDQADPTTWRPAYYLAAGYIFFAAAAIALLVREPRVPILPEHTSEIGWRELIRSVLAAPNAKPILAGLLLASAAGGAFERTYPIYARDALGAGGDDLAAASIASIVLAVVLIPLSVWLAGRIKRRTLAFLAGISWFAGAMAHLWLTELWQSVVVLGVASVLVNTAMIALAAMALRIVPRRGGLAQRLGLTFAPFLVVDMIARFGSALIYDLVVQDFAVIWVSSAVLGLASGCAAMAVRLPPWAQRADLAHGWSQLRKILWGRRADRRLFRGDRSADDNGVALLEAVQDALDPYVLREPRQPGAAVST